MVLVDSTVWIDFLRGRSPEPVARLRELLEPGEAAIAPVILQEILQGASSPASLETLKSYFLALPILKSQSQSGTYTAAAALCLNDMERNALLKQQRSPGPDSSSLRTQVLACRQRQLARNGRCNAKLEQQQVQEFCALTKGDTKLLNDAMTRLQLSARATFRILKIARTIADLDATERITTPHLIEAINYRRFDTL